MDSRAVAPVVGKLLAAGIATLFIAGTTSILLGGVVPEYKTSAGEELGERVLATAAGTIERTVPDVQTRVAVRTRIDLPATIRNRQYVLTVRNRTLHLDHPKEVLNARATVKLPSRVSVRNGTWASGGELVVAVSGPPDNRTLSLMEGAP